MKKLKMMGIMLFVSTVLVGCGTTAETKIDEKATEKTSVSKKVLNLMENSEIGSMDSIFTQDEASINAQSNVFEGLYQLDEYQLPLKRCLKFLKMANDIPLN